MFPIYSGLAMPILYMWLLAGNVIKYLNLLFI